jgi:hypothetical protein
MGVSYSLCPCLLQGPVLRLILITAEYFALRLFVRRIVDRTRPM